MTDTSSGHDLVELLAEEFLQRSRRGEKPTIAEYCAKYPDKAEEIRDLLGTMQLMEDLQPASADATVAHLSAQPSLEQVRGYRILGEIGRGGMGIVYDAEQESLGRRVALKVLPQRSLLSENARNRFVREARAAASMHHTNIVPVFEVGEEGDCFFYAMQLIQGQSLDCVIDELKELRIADSGSTVDQLRSLQSDSAGRTSPISGSGSTGTATLPGESDGSIGGSRRQRFYRSVARIGLQVARALAYAHARGIIHRDIKPSNLLLDANGVVWVTDFGLAKTDKEGLTQTGDFLGTLRYMSPERFSGKCDARADVYALGLTLYELLVQRPAFESSDRLELVDRINRTSPPTPRSLDSRIPHDLETIVLTATDRDPKLRYAGAKELANDLQRFIDDVPIRARRASLTERLFRWSRRNKALAASLSGVAMLLAVLALVSTLAWFSELGLRRLAEQRGDEINRSLLRESELRQLAEQQGDEIKRNRNEIKRHLYFTDMSLAGHAAAAPYGADTVKARLSEWLPAQAGVDLRGWEWYYLYSLVHRDHFTSDRLDNCTSCVEFSPDGKRFAAAVNGFGFNIWDADTGRLILEKHTGSCQSVAFSPDGKRLATSGVGGTASIWQVSDGEELLQLKGHVGGEVVYVAWSPDGRWLATSSHVRGEPHMLRIWDATTGKEIRRLDGHTNDVTVVRWRSDSSRLASASSDGTARIWDPATGEELLRFGTPSSSAGSPVWAVCWSPDGTKLVSVGDDEAIRVWDVDTKREIATIEPEAGSTRCLHWRPGSAQLASAHTDGSVSLWDTATGQRLSTFLGHTGEVRCIKWSPDGLRLASASLDKTVRIWDVDTDDPQRLLDGGAGVRGCIAWSRDGARSAWESARGGEVVVWEAATGTQQVIHRWQWGTTGAWSPDETRLAFGGREAVMRVWDASTGEVVELELETAFVTSIVWNRDGSRLASVAFDGDVSVWNMDTPSKIATIAKPHGQATFCVDWSCDSARLATVGSDATVKVWDPVTGEVIWQAKRDSRTISSVRWSPDGTRLATAHAGALVLWDGLSGAEIKAFDSVEEDFSTVDWSPDSTRLATGSKASVSVWGVASGHVALRIPSRNTAIQRVRWNRDGERLFADHGDSVRIYEATIGYQQNGAGL